MNIRPEWRYFVTGKTQSGKTYLAKKILMQCKNRLMYDVKREYGDLGVVVHTLQQLAYVIKEGAVRIVYQPEDLSPEHFNEVCRFVYLHLKNIMFAVDEVQSVCTKSYIPKYFKLIITVRQADGVGVMAITQRPQNVHNDVLSQSSVWFVFKITQKHDADAVERNTGIPADALQALPYRHFYTYDDRAEHRAVVKHRPL